MNRWIWEGKWNVNVKDVDIEIYKLWIRCHQIKQCFVHIFPILVGCRIATSRGNFYGAGGKDMLNSLFILTLLKAITRYQWSYKFDVNQPLHLWLNIHTEQALYDAILYCLQDTASAHHTFKDTKEAYTKGIWKKIGINCQKTWLMQHSSEQK